MTLRKIRLDLRRNVSVSGADCDDMEYCPDIVNTWVHFAQSSQLTGTSSVQHCHMRLTSTGKSLYFVNFSVYFLAMLPSAGQLMSRTQVFVFLFLKQMSGGLTSIFLDGFVPPYSDVVRLHHPIRMMPVPYALHWNPSMTTNVLVDNGGHLIVSISVVYWCQGTTRCHNVVNCSHAYTAQAASEADISMQNVALIIPCPKILVLSSNNQSLSCSRKIR